MEIQEFPSKLIGDKNQKLALPNIIKSEVNFLVFPFFALSRKGLKTKTKTEYRETIKRGDEKLEIVWNVSANPEYGYPGPFDREVHKAIEQIISEILQRDGKITNPIRLCSFYELCKRMGSGSLGGFQYREIKRAFERVVTTSVKSKGTFYNKGEERCIDDTFHLYERVIFKNAKLPNGDMADTNYLFLGSWYLESLNAFYVKPLDYQYLKSLKGKIASRLYEILGVRFYGLQRRRQPSVWYKYHTLCQLLPITPQEYYSKAKQVLQAAHKELTKTRFLSKVEWQKKSKNEWIIYYYPGKRFYNELKQNQQQLEFPIPKEKKSVSPDQEDNKELISLLTNQGISEHSAKQLAKTYPRRIPEKIEIFDWIKSQTPEKIKDSAAYLRRMIEENWPAPEGFVPKKEIEAKRKAKKKALEAERKERIEAAKAKAEELVSRSPEERVDGLLKAWLFTQEQQPTEEEIEAKKKELIPNLITREEYERQLIDEIEREIQEKQRRVQL